MTQIYDLQTIHEELRCLGAELTDDEWRTPTAAMGWVVKDQFAHLADTEEVAHDTLTGDERRFPVAVSTHPTAEAFTQAGVDARRDTPKAELMASWERAAARTAAALGTIEPSRSVEWGFGMTAETFARARVMEHWAHGCDVTDALGRPPLSGRYLRAIAELGLLTLPYALLRARVSQGRGQPLHLALSGPDGETWRLGPESGTNRIQGPAEAWCRVVVRRARPVDRSALLVHGPTAEAAMAHARAYL